ncbi:MAG: hypothetical protein MK116_10935 [Phycisphaerales bacterium]|nr:hypothetical protein [Phycisphaerales bacterium]
MVKVRSAALCAAAVSCTLAVHAIGAELNVPGEYPTIQEAIDAASAGDTILVGPGVYDGPIDINENVQIISTDGAETTAIDGSSTSDSVVSIVQRNHFTLLKGFTIQNGDGGTPVGQDETIIVGGGVRILGGFPSIESCVFENNHSGYGGGVHSDGAFVTIRDCVFRGNSASANAGGALAINGGVEFDSCVFDDNFATQDGGGVKIVKGTSMIRNCQITNNSALDGGGLFWYAEEETGPLVVMDTVITGNMANDAGGIRALYDRAPVILTGSTVCDNANFQIVGPFTESGDNTLCVCPADLDNDGTVAVDDVLILLTQWGSEPALGDLDFDGEVGVSDLLAVLAAYGPCE